MVQAALLSAPRRLAPHPHLSSVFCSRSRSLTRGAAGSDSMMHSSRMSSLLSLLPDRHSRVSWGRAAFVQGACERVSQGLLGVAVSPYSNAMCNVHFQLAPEGCTHSAQPTCTSSHEVRVQLQPQRHAMRREPLWPPRLSGRARL